jgi:hypothetical protein
VTAAERLPGYVLEDRITLTGVMANPNELSPFFV